MIKVNIININEFLRTVNNCSGPVYMLTPEQKKVNINNQYDIQQDLRNRHQENKQYLPLILDIPTPSDYMSIISYYAGDV